MACNSSEADDEGLSLPEAKGEDSARHGMMTYTLTFALVQAQCFEQTNKVETTIYSIADISPHRAAGRGREG